MTYKLGSLFDGSGGFPLAGALCGVEPVWAAEVEPYPIAVTRSRFPNMKHLGDISKVNGAEIEPVDIITFGSPCQDLSVAGKRAGLKHEANGDEETTRSGLFMEAVRIIKEMRTATNGEYPRFALWENVPGAFSSNRGEDFRIVLEELIRVTTPDAVMPPVPKAGWNYADSYVLDGASIAYRVLDAQYWGVPQRRRRIYLVADFRGECAREVLFKREGLRGYFAEGRTPWQAAPADAQGSTGADDTEGEMGTRATDRGSDGSCRGRQLDAIIDTHILDDQGGSVINVRTDGQAPTLRAQMGGHPPVILEPVKSGGFCPEQSAKTRGIGFEEEKSPTLRAGVVPGAVMSFHCTQDPISSIETIPCITAGSKKGQAVVGVVEPICLDRAFYNQGVNAKYDPQLYVDECPTLIARGPAAVAYKEPPYHIARRLTPTECARLQGFADWWSYVEPKTDFTGEEYRFWLEVRNTHARINDRAEKDYTPKAMLTWYNKLYTDSAEYKMWGNGIALPTALYVLQGITDALNNTEEDESWML